MQDMFGIAVTAALALAAPQIALAQNSVSRACSASIHTSATIKAPARADQIIGVKNPGCPNGMVTGLDQN